MSKLKDKIQDEARGSKELSQLLDTIDPFNASINGEAIDIIIEWTLTQAGLHVSDIMKGYEELSDGDLK